METADDYFCSVDTEVIRGQNPPKFFVAPRFVVLRKFCSKHIIKTKIFPS